MSTIISLYKLIKIIWVIFKWLKMAHITLIDLKTDLPMPIITIFDLPSLMHLKANYLAFNTYLDKQYRLYTDCAIK